MKNVCQNFGVNFYLDTGLMKAWRDVWHEVTTVERGRRWPYVFHFCVLPFASHVVICF